MSEKYIKINCPKCDKVYTNGEIIRGQCLNCLLIFKVTENSDLTYHNDELFFKHTLECATEQPIENYSEYIITHLQTRLV